MATPSLLRALVELATCESVEALLDDAFTLLERELGMRGRIELWDGDDAHFSRGEPARANAQPHGAAPYRTWIGLHYTLGAIELPAPPAAPDDVELLACQLAPLAERLIEYEASQRRTIRDDVEHLYERRIRDALVRHDWNASAVARELSVSRGRVAEIARRWRARCVTVFRTRTTNVIPNTDTGSTQNTRSATAAAYRCRDGDKQHSHVDSVLRARQRFI